jgi:hypothetical protein
MRVIKEHYFNHKKFSDGQEILEKENLDRLAEVLEAIKQVDLKKCIEPSKPGKPKKSVKSGKSSKTSKSSKSAQSSKTLYSPGAMAQQILGFLYSRGWSKPKIMFGKPDNFIEGDGSKNGVGLELQFGKYSFLGWDSLRKMSIFASSGVYRYGIEIAPMASLRRKMAKGVGSFEQVTERLQKTGNPDLNIPVVVLGIDG